MISKTLLAFLLLLHTVTVSMVFAADPSYWVTYQVNAFTKTSSATTWTPLYSAPFGLAVGYSTGPIFSDATSTNSSQPNCFSFSFEPIGVYGLTSLRQQVTVTEYPGNQLCVPTNPNDPSQITTLAQVQVTVTQGQSNTFEFPYFDGRQIQIQLSQSWAAQ